MTEPCQHVAKTYSTAASRRMKSVFYVVIAVAPCWPLALRP